MCIILQVAGPCLIRLSPGSVSCTIVFLRKPPPQGMAVLVRYASLPKVERWRQPRQGMCHTAVLFKIENWPKNPWLHASSCSGGPLYNIPMWALQQHIWNWCSSGSDSDSAQTWSVKFVCNSKNVYIWWVFYSVSFSQFLLKQ